MQLHEYSFAVEYVPEWGGNRELDEPAVVVLTPMSAAELRKHRISEASKMRGSTGLIERMIDDTLSSHIHSIRNVTKRTHNADGTHSDVQMTDIAEFVKHAPDALRAELYEAVTDTSKLTERLKKKSNSQHASS